MLKEDDELIREVYEYWIKKRKNCRGPSLIPAVKQEKRDGSSTNDPYVAFRRRTEKMQTRKVSRSIPPSAFLLFLLPFQKVVLYKETVQLCSIKQ